VRRLRPAGIRRAVSAVLVLAAALSIAPLLPAPASGQQGGGDAAELRREGRPDDGGLEVVGFAGFFTPLATLSDDPGSFATEMSSAGAFGGGAGWWFGPIGVIGEFLYVPGDLTVRPSEFGGPIPNDLGDADYLAGTVNVAYRLRLPGPASVVEPYFALGGGLRDLSFDPIAQRDVSDATDPVGSVAAGTSTRIFEGGLLRFQIRDLISTFEAPGEGSSTIQNDIVVSIGFAYRP